MKQWAVCSVCGDRATRLRYSHYGAVSCFSCRAFFRRAIEKGSVYTCQKSKTGNALAMSPEMDGGCVMTVTSRKKCAACRFAKCKRVGMKHGTEAENQNPERALVNTNNLIRHIRVELENAEEKTLLNEIFTLPLEECFYGISLEEVDRVEELANSDRSTRISLGEAVFNQAIEEKHFSWSLVKNIVRAALTGQALKISAICWGYTLGIRKLTRFSMAVPEFASLSLTDQKALLLHNLDPMFNIRSGFFFQTEGVADDLHEQLERFSIFDITRLTNCTEWVPFGDMLSNYVTVPSVKWHQFFTTPWANSVEHERKYEYLVSYLNSLQLDFQSACLLSLVALFSTEGIDETLHLSQSSLAKIRGYQLGFSKLLYRYLCHVRGQAEATKKFPAFMQMLHNLREMSDIMKNKTIKIFNPPSIERQVSMEQDAFIASF